MSVVYVYGERATKNRSPLSFHEPPPDNFRIHTYNYSRLYVYAACVHVQYQHHTDVSSRPVLQEDAKEREKERLCDRTKEVNEEKTETRESDLTKADRQCSGEVVKKLTLHALYAHTLRIIPFVCNVYVSHTHDVM